MFARFKRWGSAHNVLGQFRFFDRETFCCNKPLMMGASNAKPLKCPLCHEDCREQVTLGCGHSFCRVCISELWSGSDTGPYYCPECRYEYQQLPDYTDGASTSTATPNTRTGVNTQLNNPWLVDLDGWLLAYVIFVVNMCKLTMT